MSTQEIRRIFKEEANRALLFTESKNLIYSYQYISLNDAPYNTLLFNLSPMLIKEGDVLINVERYSLFMIVHPDTLNASGISLKQYQKDSIVLYFDSLITKVGGSIQEHVGKVVHVTVDKEQSGLVSKVLLANSKRLPINKLTQSYRVDSDKFCLADLLYGQLKIAVNNKQDLLLQLVQQHVVVYKISKGQNVLDLNPYATIPFLLGSNRGLMDTRQFIDYIK